ncbi:MAG: phosphoribosylformylglycinamidine cyclo-ligase [Candidatus Vogelbacteria bacterium]|nr:phosphoribosylformylglycinamidine cyclo-ligase [Candidatus Vogelbacteria bacterium]
MSEELSTYEKRGVSSEKSEVHAAITTMDKGLYPGAFCTILPDVFDNDPTKCIIQHADGAGTKAGLAYLYWKLTGDLSVWKGIVRDSLFMNVDDAMCAGAMGPFVINMTVGRNKALIPGEVIKTLIEYCQFLCEWLTGIGIPCYYAGGETADLGDLIRTITVDNVITVKFQRRDVIDASRIRPGGIIVGFSSTGQATYENEPNSGMGSNGLTNARHDSLHPDYRVHTETYAPETLPGLIYCGEHWLGGPLSGDPRFTIAQALLSPTRTYLPMVKKLFEELGRESIQGLIHCSGGGQTKIGKFGQPGNVYVKDKLFPTPPLFQFLQVARKLSWREMFSSYNCGHRLEAVVSSRSAVQLCIQIAAQFDIAAKEIGRVEEDQGVTLSRRVIIKQGGTKESYDFKV